MDLMRDTEPDMSCDGVSPVTLRTRRVLLVWDAPNLDMGLGSILGGRPTAAHRPRFDALGRWLLARTAELSAGQHRVSLEPGATAFTNIAPRPGFDALGRWLLARTAELSAGQHRVSLEPEATVFTNIAPGSADVVRP